MLVRLLAIMKPAETIFRCYILYYNTKKRGETLLVFIRLHTLTIGTFMLQVL